MEKAANIKLYTLDEVTDELIGKKGTKQRDNFDNEVEEALHAYQIGEAIKKARMQNNLTQEELGERVGVQKRQISKMEKGYSISLPAMSRVFKALGITTGTLDLGMAGKVALW